MSNPEDSAPTQQNVSPPSTPPAAESKSQSPPASSFGVSEIVSRWRREDVLKRRALALRGFAFIFSLLAFVIMASNKHGDWKDFDKYEEFRWGVTDNFFFLILEIWTWIIIWVLKKVRVGNWNSVDFVHGGPSFAAISRTFNWEICDSTPKICLYRLYWRSGSCAQHHLFGKLEI